MAPKKAATKNEAPGKTEVSQLKRTVKNPFLYAGTIVILVITVVAFVFIPAIGGSDSQSTPSFGSYNGKRIVYEPGGYFATQVQQINSYLREQGLSEENFQQYAFQVWRSAYESTVLRYAIIDEVRSSGYSVSEKELDARVAENEAYRIDGRFSPQLYRDTPLSRKLSIRTGTEEDLYIKRYYDELYRIAPGKDELGFVTAMAKDRRSIAYVTFPFSSYPDAEVAAWAETSADLFRKVSISRITITSSESDAKKVLKQVRDQALTFEEAAKSHSRDAFADKGGDSGPVYFHDFAESFKDKADAGKVVALAPGEVSDIVQVAEKAWAFFKVNAAPVAPDFADPATLAEARNYMETNERGKLETWALKVAGEFASAARAPGAGLQSAARKSSLSVRSAGPFPINYGAPSFVAYGQNIPLFEPVTSEDPVLAAAQSDETFFKTVFSLPDSAVSDPVALGDAVIVASVTDRKPADDADVSLLGFSYPYFFQSTLDAEVRVRFLKNPKFRDEFTATFFKYFTPADQPAAAAES